MSCVCKFVCAVCIYVYLLTFLGCNDFCTIMNILVYVCTCVYCVYCMYCVYCVYCMYCVYYVYCVYCMYCMYILCLLCVWYVLMYAVVYILSVSGPRCSLLVDMFAHTVSQGYGQFLENRIHCNTYAGVWVTWESEPTLKDNEICDGQQGACTSLEMGGVFSKGTISMATLYLVFESDWDPIL